MTPSQARQLLRIGVRLIERASKRVKPIDAAKGRMWCVQVRRAVNKRRSAPTRGMETR